MSVESMETLQLPNITTGKKRKNLLWIAIAFVLVALLIPFTIAVLPWSVTTILILFSLIVPLCGILIAYLRSESFDLFEPIYGLMSMYILSFPLRAIYAYIISPAQTILPARFYLESPGESLDLALLYGTIGLIMFLLGYFSPWSHRIVQRLPTVRSRAESKNLVLKIISIFLVGLFFNFVKFRTGSFSVFIRESSIDSSYSYVVDLGAQFIYYALILVLIVILGRAKQERGFLWLIYMGMLAINIAVALLAGAKLPIATIFIGSAIVFYYLSSSRKKLLYIAAIGLSIMLIFPIMSTFRLYYLQIVGYTTRLSVARVMDLVSHSNDFVEISSEQSGSLVDSIMNRTVALDSLIVAIKYTPEVMDFQYGQDLFIAPFLALVPRIIWPDKPTMGLTAEQFTILYMGSTRTGYDSDWAGGSAITPMGDLYINFHVFGIIVGMFLMGVIAMVLWLYMKRSPTLVVLLMYIIGYVALLNLDTPFSGFLSEWPKLLAVFWLLHRFFVWDKARPIAK